MAKPLRTRWGILAALLAAVAVIVTLQQFGVLAKLAGAASYPLKPLQSFFTDSAQSVRNFFTYFGNTSKLRDENKQLGDTVASLTLENQKLRSDLRDSKLASEQLDYITQHSFNSVTGKVVARSSDSNSLLVVINKGSSSGVAVGYPVIASGGFIVGKVVEVNSQAAKVLLLTDNASKISAVTENSTNSPGMVSGQLGITLKLELVPQDQQLSTGDLVVTAGLEKNIPSGLIIGTVAQVTKKSGELFQGGTVEPVVSYQNLSIVSVLLPSDG